VSWEGVRFSVFLKKLSNELAGEDNAIVDGRVRPARAKRLSLLSKLAFEVGK
jgi:hypothetical protein